MYNINIGEITFEWDAQKNTINIKKHGISFEEAATVFYDDEALLFDNPDHSIEENRFLILGVSQTEMLCIVSHCYKDSEDRIRIISARKADKEEKEVYNEQFLR